MESLGLIVGRTYYKIGRMGGHQPQALGMRYLCTHDRHENYFIFINTFSECPERLHISDLDALHECKADVLAKIILAQEKAIARKKDQLKREIEKRTQTQ